MGPETLVGRAVPPPAQPPPPTPAAALPPPEARPATGLASPFSGATNYPGGRPYPRLPRKHSLSPRGAFLSSSTSSSFHFSLLFFCDSVETTMDERVVSLNEEWVRAAVPIDRSLLKPSNRLACCWAGRDRPPRRALEFVPGRDVRRRWDGQGHEASFAYGDLGRQGFCSGAATRTLRFWGRGLSFPWI